MLRTLITTAALLTLAATAQAQPLQTKDDAAVTVSYADLNLSSPYDAKLLADRLQTAAKQVCSTVSSGFSNANLSPCMDNAIATATAQIESDIDNHMDEEVHANLTTVRQQISLE
jgi:UrcA family protein